MSIEQAAEVAEVEQFDGFTPEGTPIDEQSVDSFDNFEPVEAPAKEEAKVEEKQEVKADDPKQTMDSADELEDKEAAKSDKAEDEEKPAEPEVKDATDEGEGKSEEEAAPQKPEGKTVRLKAGDNAVDVEENATVAVKVDGKKEFVPIKELMSNYSGKQSWDKKFTEFETEKNTFTEERTQFEGQKKEVVEHFGRIGGMIDDIYKDPAADPSAALRYLVDTAGGDVLHYEQRMLEHYGQIAADFSEMSEPERNLYWSERKNQILLDNQANRSKIDEERTAKEQRQQSEIEIRKEYGVSDKEFDEAQAELAQLGYEASKITSKQVCEYLQLKPHAEKAESICGQFEDDLGDDELVSLIRETTNVLRFNDYLSPEEAVKLAGRKLGFKIEDINDDINELNKKVASPANRLDSKDSSAKKVGKTREETHVESFDDYEADQYNY